MATTAFSTNDLLIRNSRISFAKVAPEVNSREERFVIVNDNQGYTIHLGTSTLISTVNGDILDSIFPTKAAFSFNVSSQRLAIGGISSPQYSIDISSNTGIRLQGTGSFIGDAKGLVSVPTAALFSTLPTAIFGSGTIPLSALLSTGGAILQGISVNTSSLFGYFDTSLYGPSTIPLVALKGSGLIQATAFRGDGSQLTNIPLGALNADLTAGFFKPNSIPAYALPSTGNLWIRDISGIIAAPFISTGTLTARYISSVLLISTANINVGALTTSSLTLTGKFNVEGISTGIFDAGSATILGGVQAASFIGDGSQLTNINPANLLTTIPANKFGYQTISFDSLNPYGEFRVLGGSAYIDGPLTVTGTTTSAFFAGDGSQLTNLPFGPSLASTVIGLGQFYNSTILVAGTGVSFTSNVDGTNTIRINASGSGGGIIGDVTTLGLNSTIQGLGTFGYLSTAITNLSSIISTPQLTSSLEGLGTLGYLSSIPSTFISSAALFSSLEGLGTLGYLSSIPSTFISSAALFSSLEGLGTLGYLSSIPSTFISSAALFSSLEGLGTLGYLSSLVGIGSGDVTTSTLLSSLEGLGTLGYVSTSIYNDAWIQSNLINPPPSIVFGTPVSQSAEIYIPWTYPTQLNVGFQSSWVPVINSLNVILSTQLTSINPSTIISTLSTGMVNYHNASNYITGAVLTNTIQATGVQLKTFPQDGLARRAFVYYAPTLINLNKDGQLIAWYNNYNEGRNMASTIFSPFLAAGPPSVPRKLQSTNVTFQSLSFFFSTPQDADTLNPGSVATITRYDLSFNSVPIPGVRYGTAIYDAQTANFLSPFSFVTSPDSTQGNVIQYNATSLHPDSKYNFYVKATNSASIAGPFASTLGISTSFLVPDSGMTVNFLARYFSGTIKRVTDNVTVTTLLNTNTDWTSSNFIVPLHIQTNRGTTSAGIATLATAISGAVSATGPTVTFGGFPATTPAAGTQNNLTVTPTNVYDQYTTPTRYQGFYLKASNTVTITQATFSASLTQYTHTTTLTQVTTPITSQLSFYYDGLLGTATVLDMAFNFSVGTPPTNTYISGVRVVSGQPTLSTITGASNLGTYFYKNPLLSYTNTAGSVTTSFSETDLSRVVSGSNSGQLLNQRIGFSNGSFQLNSLASAYATSIAMTVTAANPSNTSGAFSATALPCIVDGPSVTLINTTLPGSLNTLTSGVSGLGCRIWSFSNYDATTLVPPYIFASNAANYSYTGFLYTTTWHQYSIVGSVPAYVLSNELQVTNGAHRSKGTRTDCYIDYTTKKYSATDFNTVDYSGVLTSGHRFATFAWKVANQNTNFSVLRFTITYVAADTDAVSVLNNLLIFTGTSDTLKVFYKVEDQASVLPTDGTSPTTVWLDANGTVSNSATSLTYYSDSTGTYQQVYGGVTSGASIASPTILFPSLFIPSFATPSSTDVRIICRIGIPMNRNFAFSQVTATIS